MPSRTCSAESARHHVAMSLNNLANRLSDLGRREEALACAEEAASLRDSQA